MVIKYESYLAGRHDRSAVKEILSYAIEEELEQALVRYEKGEISLCLAVEEGKIVGCIGFQATSGEILHIAVEPAMRGRHIARHLIEFITGRVLSPLLKVNTVSECVPFFEACGFICDAGEGGRFHGFRVNRGKRCC